MKYENPSDDLNELTEMTRAAQADVPTDSDWEAARERLAVKLRTKELATRVRRQQQQRFRPRPIGLTFSAMLLLALVLLPMFLFSPGSQPLYAGSVGSGQLQIIGANGEPAGSCPLKHTEVEANIIGFISRTIVKQTFTNPLDKKIEAVYVFPLPADSAVNSMVIIVGGRRTVGVVKPREEARKVYEDAKARGKVAGLLDQDRPNIFTQSVANIDPGATVEVEISYVETLKFEDGTFEFHFPMTVGPRYIPGAELAPDGSTTSAQVPDANRLAANTQEPDVRAGHDISIDVFLDAGVEIQEINSERHEVETDKSDPSRALISLKNRTEIPNKDFVLRYRTANAQITDALLTTKGVHGDFFMLMLQPPVKVEANQARPKEMIFVIDKSGSMTGAPIETAKKAMELCIEQMGPNDEFNLLSFSGGLGKAFEAPVPNNEANRAAAQKYLSALNGGGGTEMMPAIIESLGRPADPTRVRIVCFMTDGEIGNDFAIIDAVKKNVATSRVFAFGIGSSVNRFLLDAMAREGRGEVDYIPVGRGGTKDPLSLVAAAERFAKRVSTPVLTDIQIDWGNLPVGEVYPKNVPDLFAAKPIVVFGRLTGPASGEITLRGNTGAGVFQRQVQVQETQTGSERRDAIDTLWARQKVTHLMGQNLRAMQSGHFPTELKDEITSIGVAFSLMTQFTSFVAVDEQSQTNDEKPETVQVPTEMPEGQVVGAGEHHYGLPGLVPASPAATAGKTVTFYVQDAGEVQKAVSRSPGKAKNTASFRDTTFSRPALSQQALQQVPVPASSPTPRAERSLGLDADGDMKAAGGKDNNFFLFTDKFAFDAHVEDEKSGPAATGSPLPQLSPLHKETRAGAGEAYTYDPTDGTVSLGDVWRVDERGQRADVAQKTEAESAANLEWFREDSRKLVDALADHFSVTTSPLAREKRLQDAIASKNWERKLHPDLLKLVRNARTSPQHVKVRIEFTETISDEDVQIMKFFGITPPTEMEIEGKKLEAVVRSHVYNITPHQLRVAIAESIKSITPAE